jgi:ferritin-like metal-binding protein YciE
MVDDHKADIEEFKREAASGSDPPGKSVCRQNPADLRRAPEDGGADGSRTKKIAKWPRRTGAVCVFPLWNGCCQFSGHKPTIASKGKFMAEPKFETLFREQLESLYNAENQNAAALPKMIAAASSEELAGLLHSHLEETHQQVARLEHIFESMGEEPAVRESTGMKGLIQECENLISRLDKGALLDAAMIDSVQKVERYEICGYGTVQVLAEILGQQDTADLLEETIEEEKAADEGLWEIAESIFEGAGAVYSDTDIEAVILEEHRR